MPLLNEVPNKHVIITTGSGDVEISGGTCVGVYVGDISGGAILVLKDRDGVSAAYQGVSAGDIIPGRFTKMVDAQTTAAGLIVLLRA